MKAKFLLFPLSLCFMLGSCVSDSQNSQDIDSLSRDSMLRDSAQHDSMEVEGVVPDSTRREAPIH